MQSERIDKIISSQRAYFESGKTLNVNFRIEALKKLHAAINKHEAEIAKALECDLGKSAYESYMCEIGLALSEITYMIKNVRKLSKERRVRTPLAQFASRSYVKPSPYGNVLIMSPWNYPFLLTIDPVADAIAAGNTAIVKPSAYSPATSEIIEKIIAECFSPEYIAVVTGGRSENSALLDKKFNLIFFTGSQNVGREVMRRAAENLTPTVLELGGKSPCIVDGTAKLSLAAKRIVFGKFLNCGQTCVAPDYVLCERSVKDKLVAEIISQIKVQFGEEPLKNPDYGKIINAKHFGRIEKLIEKDRIIYGGERNSQSQKIAPTLIEGDWNCAAMREEIFGPVLPILTFDSFDEVYSALNGKPEPLALYIFSQDKSRIREVTARCRYGGGCVNDTVIHLATSEMGFGGVGESGMGAYHGEVGFKAFSHEKSIVDKKTFIDLPMRYQPYKSRLYQKLVRMFLK
ncbi:MAG: aldehyde dehydrogenase [Candidatus Coproplasma sp.]